MCVRVLREIAVVEWGKYDLLHVTYVIIVITSEGNCIGVCVCIRSHPSVFLHTHRYEQ